MSRRLRVTGLAVVLLLTACNAQGIEPIPSGSPVASAPATDDIEKVRVVGTEFSFAPADLKASAGTPLAVTFANEGSVDHDWTVFDSEGVPVMGLHAHAPAGEEATVLLDLEPGKYQVWCTIPGHREAGMVGSITIK